MPNFFKAIDKLLLPRHFQEQFSPYVWLIYLLFFLGPVLYFSPNPKDWIWAGLATVCFLVVYFHAHWVNRDRIYYHILLITLIGTLSALFTPSAQTVFIYAAAFSSRLRPVKYSFLALAGIVSWMAVISWWFSFSPNFYIPGIFFSIVVGLLNIYQYALNDKKQELILSQKEVKRLAKVSERERIARDLHDLIGHTFSVITIKADLAGRMLDKNLERARIEIKQLEDISRDALSQVREVISGYRTSDLLSELANAKYVLASVNVDFNYELKGLEENELELELTNIKELAIVLRELVTNIIKHAKATEVNAIVCKNDEDIILSVQDNGTGFQLSDNGGFGIKGIRERLAKINGQLNIVTGGEKIGTLTEITVPSLT